MTDAPVDARVMPLPIFVFSMPRSGSTLLQRLLGAHSQIATATEPHLLLPPLYTLKPKTVYGEYGHELSRRGYEDFIKLLPGGMDAYREALRNFMLDLYCRATPPTKRFFVDKTPRYALIAPEILELFPQGRFLMLWRNPLAVVASIVSSFYRNEWRIQHHLSVLERGLVNLVNVKQTFGDRVCALRYEDLVTEPDATLRRVFAYLELPFEEQVITQFGRVRIRGALRDTKMDLPESRRVHTESLSRWRESLGNPLRKRWCTRYLRYLGRERLAVMGYNLDELLAELNAVPTNTRYLASDLRHMPLAWAYDRFEFRLVKDKWDALRRGERNYLHE